MNKIIFIMGIFILVSCAQTEYFVIGEVPMNSQNGGVNKNNFSRNSTGFNKRAVKPILISQNTFNDMKIDSCKLIFELLNRKKFLNAEKIIKSYNLNENSIAFLQSLISLLKSDFNSSLTYLNNVSDDVFHFEKKMLRLDVLFEIKKRNYTLDKHMFLKSYQSILDLNNLSKNQKDIIHNRVKFLRYTR